jgi:hypothetical protein
MSSVENPEEQKESLAHGDPEAGYVGRDMSGVLGTGTVPDVEQEAYDANVKAHEDEVKTVEENEDAVVKQRRKDAEDAEAETEAAPSSTKTSSTKTSSSSSSSSSS